MRRFPFCRSVQAFSRNDLLVVLIGVVLLTALLLPAMARARARAQRISCLCNLKQIGLSYRQWALDHTNAYPMAISTNFGGTLEHVAAGEVWPHFQVMSNELNTPVVLVCPSDRGRFRVRRFGSNLSNSNLSYFVGLDANDAAPQMFLAGDRNLVGGTMLSNRILLLTTKDALRWSQKMHVNQGNVATADGSVQGFSRSKLHEALAHTGVVTNRLAMP